MAGPKYKPVQMKQHKFLLIHWDQHGRPPGKSGLSNWRLDPAKMNRSVCLARPDPDSAEVGRTGHGAAGGWSGGGPSRV